MPVILNASQQAQWMEDLSAAKEIFAQQGEIELKSLQVPA